MELRASTVTMNPRRWKAGSPESGTNQHLAELIFDRLISLDKYGNFQPQLATEWSHDITAKRWQFTLRQGVQFSDGSLLTPGDVAAALQPQLPAGMRIAAFAGGVMIQSVNPANDLLEQLASGANFVYRSEERGSLLGTGPFALDGPSATSPRADKLAGDITAQQTPHLRFHFNELCWSGRPFVDAIDVTLGVPPSRALLDLQLGKVEVAELSEDTARRAQQSSVKLWVSSPLTLYAVKFATPAKSLAEKAFREALSLSLERNAMARVLLQKQAEGAPCFLPQWLSGYAFLFDMEGKQERAKAIRSTLPASAVGVTQPLRLVLDAGGDLSRLIAERVVVNARAAGLTVQIVPHAAGRTPNESTAAKSESEAQLIFWRYTSLSPREAWQSFAATLRWENAPGDVPADAEARYAWEKHIMEGNNILPLVAVPDFVAMDAQVRNWSPSAWGEWHLADVWLDASEAGSNSRDTAGKTPAGVQP